MTPASVESSDRGPQGLLWAVVEASPTGILLVDATGRIVMANQQIERIVGYPRADLIGRPLEALLPERSRAIHRDHVSHFGADPHPRQLGTGRDLYARHFTGRDVPVEVGLAPLEYEGRSYVLASVIDITERRAAEQAVKASAAYHRTILENIGDAIFIADPEGRYVYVNPRACELTGYGVEELLRLRVTDTYPPERRDEAAGHVSAVAAGRPIVLERPLLRKDGRIVVVEANARPLSAGQMLATVRDVTERRELEQKLLQAQKMEAVGRLAGGVAHDFNNMLTAIFGYTDLMSEDLPPDSPMRQDIAEVRKAAQRASGLTRQLLAFSRQQVLEPVVLNANDLIQDFEKMLGRMIGEDVQLRLALASDLGNVRADPGQIQQVLMNLVVNARDAMPTGGHLVIETANADLAEQYVELHQPVVPGRYVMLAVTDTGIGMSADIKTRIFEPFFTTKEKGKGTGLGLSTVYGIVKQSGGYVWVYSEPGRGTTFKIYMPRVDAPAQAPSAPREATALTGTETILIAEDDEILRRLTKGLLEKAGYRVLEAENAALALAAARAHQGTIHLLLADVVMPGGSGRDLARQLAEFRPNIKVLYVSGYTDDAIVHHGMLEPGLNFLPKPFTPAALARRVREVLDAI